LEGKIMEKRNRLEEIVVENLQKEGVGHLDYYITVAQIIPL
jgi:hypothetical protein